MVLSWIIGSMTEAFVPQIIGANTAREAWEKLSTAYASGSKAQVRTIKTKFFRLEKGTSETISQYL